MVYGVKSEISGKSANGIQVIDVDAVDVVQSIR